ncbi:hypothetical protein HPP92_010134 [Vanilla planifolia]|uniref:AP2/ERF domain-containing protein n=1 Tax=Vanilla planifolia TaxID=51239 RepID=A0A835V361_VANPL|nr:hypothetical protein HPP92_010134 [Vanilla planifolia]
MAKKRQSDSASIRESGDGGRDVGEGNTKVKRTRRSVPRESPSQRSSIYRGVTRHRWTGRYEAHLWDKNCWNESQNKKGRQVYLGAYDDEMAAARAYDLAALKHWGKDTVLNFPLSNYPEELKEMEDQSKEEYIGSLRRKSSGFSRGVSKYRGVARHHHNGRWEARIGRVFGNKYLYLGTYATQEEAATAYDLAAIEYRGLNAVTNFDLSRYIKWLRPNPETSQAADPSSSLHLGPQQQPRKKSGLAASSSSALGLLLRTSKFEETPDLTSSMETPPSPPESDGKTARCSFPEDIQTYFECHEGEGFVEGDGTIFGELNAFETPIFQCGLDV